MAESLTFVIQPETQEASIDLFFKSLESIRKLLHDVDYAIHRERTGRRWIISRLGSSAPSLTVQPLLGDKETVDIIASGIRAVTNGTDQPPQYFTEEALQDLIDMRRLFTGRDRASFIRVSANEEEIATIRHDISTKAGRILTAGYKNLGSLEGTLEVINLHGTPSFKIWDRVSNAPVRCFFPNTPDWKGRVKENLERRVAVTGTIRYFINGIPRTVTDILELQDITPDPSLPRAEFGSIPDEEASHNPVEFLHSIRGGERSL
ncbi:MAG: hypothetical protein IIB15_03105 [Chloroflexi bacterium]|nr:hypothetical protein [Chloroflexota bacterium]